MSRQFTSRALEDFREEVSALPGRTLAHGTRRPQTDQRPGRPSEADRVDDTPWGGCALDARYHACSMVCERDRSHRLGHAEVYSLIELGKFRIIGFKDLSSCGCHDSCKELKQGIRNLLQQGLILQGTFRGPEANARELLTLTKTGYTLLHANCLVPKGQAVYYGFVKPKEANHDANLYRMYQKEARRIYGQGGRNLRVCLDFEFRKRLAQDFTKFGIESKPEIASWHGLKVVRGKILLPDVRIEYETHEGELARVDLELVTEHYNPCQLTEKVRAGFLLYAPRGEADRLCRALDQRELAAEIVSL